VHLAEQAEQIIVMPHHDLSDNCYQLACLGMFALHQSRLTLSANRMLASPSLVMLHMHPRYRSNIVLT
jgi:hypothetical protein